MVYNFQVAENHNYAVSRSAVLVHNQSWLTVHEMLGGHTLQMHVAKTDAYLALRLTSSIKRWTRGLANHHISGSSTFTNKALAESVISRTINQERAAINLWARSAPAGALRRYNYIGNPSQTIGRGIEMGASGFRNMSNARVVLRATGDGKWYVYTAYPR